jgi:peroxiredoxin
MESAGVRLIGVNTGDQVGAARAFIESAALSYPSVVDTTGDVARAFGAHQLPTLVLIDGKGNIVSVQSRIVSESELLAELQQLLSAS